MTYLEALEMKQDMLVALQYKEVFPDQYKEVANKYSAAQWMECRKVIFENLDEKKNCITDLVKFVMMVRRKEKNK